MKWPWKKKTEPVEMGNDPLDPHGDGTLRAGDPLFDLMMGDPKPRLFTRRDDGKWDVQE